MQNRPLKIIDQVSNVGILLSNPKLVLIGTMGNTTDGITGTLAYNDVFADMIDNLTKWANILVYLSNDSRFQPWINYYTGQLSLNDFNYQYNNLPSASQNIQLANLMTTYNAELTSCKRNYQNSYNSIQNIVSTNMDGIKILTLVDGSLIIVNVMLTMLASFYNGYILNMSGVTSSQVTAQIATLTQYNNTTVKPVGFTS